MPVSFIVSDIIVNLKITILRTVPVFNIYVEGGPDGILLIAV